ncbi:YheC/YheD family protein [Brevibacillus massiliensis]|uniref:YheC/YheD family endospore coat-associated protein n=1 Tax=Brevibacillus massiliensis TaxID=1118054 RepID=UPI00036502F2|nr:YheC/YheD family protein [Brevibacillus massiliensis]
MDSILVRLRFFSHRNVTGIFLSPSMCQKLQLMPHQPIMISLGKREVPAVVLQDKKNSDSNTVRLTNSLRRELYIPHGGLIHLKREGNVLRIGPAIGIVTTGVRQDARKPIGMRTSAFYKLLLAQRGKGVFYYIFSPSDIDWDRNTVDAWFLRPTADGRYQWQYITTAVPDVVYDRIPSRNAERQEQVKDFKMRLYTKVNLPMFNCGFFNKWGVHKLLYPLEDVKEFIPETYSHASLENLRQMLKKYRMVYLKPKNGSLGYGIVKVVRQPGRRFKVSYHTAGGNVERFFSSYSSLYQHVFRNRRPSAYLVQQGVELHTYQRRPFDFRVHMHKNLQNDWVISCMAAKVAGPGSVTTHVRTGGTVIPGSDLLKSIFGIEWPIIEQRINSAAVRIAKAIEETKGDPLGELGLDMGIDVNGHVWMFEANSKPGRSVFKHAALKQADEFSRSLLIDFSCFLANF